MEVKFSIYLKEPLSLPISYHHILQSIFYKLMEDETGNAVIHDQGKHYGKRNYKLFTFGPINGVYRIEGKRIIFFDEISFEFRCLDDSLCNQIINNAKLNGIQFGNTVYKNVSIAVSDLQIEGDELMISMISPIVVYETDAETGYTTYYSPKDINFYKAVEQNFQRKYTAAFGTNPDSKITISQINVDSKDKYLTRYKNYIIEGYKGTYRLMGDPKLLQFLYNTGLGAKNSQGFGMFRILQ